MDKFFFIKILQLAPKKVFAVFPSGSAIIFSDSSMGGADGC